MLCQHLEEFKNLDRSSMILLNKALKRSSGKRILGLILTAISWICTGISATIATANGIFLIEGNND